MCNLRVAGAQELALAYPSRLMYSLLTINLAPAGSALIKCPGQESGMTVVREADILRGSLREWAADKTGYKWRVGITKSGCRVNNEPTEFIKSAS